MKRFFLLAAAAAAVTFTQVQDAHACGGCFAPPETPTVVTDHRMILSIAKDQSTLYDQIRYSGAPGSFAWVLPIAGTVDIGLSADIVFQVLDQQTQTQILPPPRNCPPPPPCPLPPSAFGGAADSSAADGGAVNVLKQEVVGPYETVQLQSSDPAALDNWLTSNGFTIPADVKPVMAQYVAEKFNFLALKLVPGKGVQDMRPVRVTTTGAGAVLPLRMVAAGTGATVGISLWIVAEGRYQPQNFPFFTIGSDDISWDWNTNRSNYTDLRAERTAAGNGRIWEIENAVTLNHASFELVVWQGSWTGSYKQTDEERAQQDYLPVTDGAGNVIQTAAQVRDADLATLFRGGWRVTRMRADLSHAALDQDLGMIASSDQSELSRTRQVTKELNQPLCPVYDGCDVVGTAPRDEAAARSSGSSSADTFSCATSTRSSHAWMGAGVTIAGVAVIHALRRRRGRRDTHP